MKNLFYVIALAAFTMAFSFTNLFGQVCVPDPQYTAPGIYPDSVTGFAPAIQCTYYEQVITNIVPTDTLDPGTGFTCDIDSVVLDNVTGLPPGMSYACVPASCGFPGGTSGCAIVYGTPTDTGTYPIVAATSAYVSGGPFGLCSAASPVVNDITYFTIVVSSPITFAVTDPSCFGNCDGQVTAIVNGPPAPYTFIWNDPGFQSSSTANSLCAGTYSVTVSDSVGCVSINSVTITDPAMLTWTTNVTDLSCNGSMDGAITINPSGGTSPYTYLWSNNATTSTANGLAAGTYIVTVMDANGCLDSSAATVTEPTAIVAITGSVDATCGNTDGLAYVSASGGAGSYFYVWDDVSNQTTDTAFGLGAGTYIVAIIDGNGCIDSASVSINDAGAPSVTVSNVVDVTCNGGSDGSAMVTASGGATPYTYQWSTGGSTTAETNMPAGTHSVTITDSAGCIAAVNVAITEPAAINIASELATDLSCNGSADGTITITASGGTGTLNFSIDSGITYANTSGSFAGLGAGTYGISIQDGSGCIQAGSTLIVSEPAAITISLETAGETSCNGGNDGTIDVVASGGTGTLNYSIDSGNTFANTSGSFVGLNAGTYGIVVQDGNGCTLTGSQLDVNEPGALMGVMSSTSESSAGASDGSAMITVSGGTSPYFYVWSTNPVQNLATATGLSSGVYGVAVTDANGCTYNDSVSVGLGGLGLEYISNKLLVNLYPNPVRNELYIDLNTENDLRFEIYNVIGDQIKSMVLRANKNKVSTAGMRAGLYLFYISDDSGMVYRGKFNIIK